MGQREATKALIEIFTRYVEHKEISIYHIAKGMNAVNTLENIMGEGERIEEEKDGSRS